MPPMMAAMTIRMGETSAFQMSNAAVMGMMAVFHVSFAALDIFQRGATIKATTAGRMPLNMRSTTGLSAKEVKQTAQSTHNATLDPLEFIAYKDGCVDGNNPRCRLCHCYHVEKLFLIHPLFFIDHLMLDEWYHGITSTERETTDAKKRRKELPIDGVHCME